MLPSKHNGVLLLLFLCKTQKKGMVVTVLILRKSDRQILSFGGQSSVYIVVELMSQSMKTTKGLFLKSTSELTQSLSSLHTAGIRGRREHRLICPRASRQRSVLLHHASAQQAVRWGRPAWSFTCSLPTTSTLNSSSRDTNHPSKPALLPGDQSDGSFF